MKISIVSIISPRWLFYYFIWLKLALSSWWQRTRGQRTLIIFSTLHNNKLSSLHSITDFILNVPRGVTLVESVIILKWNFKMYDIFNIVYAKEQHLRYISSMLPALRAPCYVCPPNEVNLTQTLPNDGVGGRFSICAKPHPPETVRASATTAGVFHTIFLMRMERDKVV